MINNDVKVVGLRIANLGLWLVFQESNQVIYLPESHKYFLQPDSQTQLFKKGEVHQENDDLVLSIKNDPAPKSTVRTMTTFDNWEFGTDQESNHIFLIPHHDPPIQITVRPDFSSGEVLGDYLLDHFKSHPYPLQDLEIRLFSAWLANYGDLILHASGVAFDNHGYAFIGDAGAGKTTLVRTLQASHNALSPLGEDQLILRFNEGSFWVYGTPWHLDPAMCNPIGVRLEKVFFLDRSSRLGSAPVRPSDGITRILQTAFIPYYLPGHLPKILERLDQLSRQVPFFSLNYQLGSDPWPLIYSV